MLNLFSKKRVHINSLAIPTFGWSIEQNNKQIKQWINPEQTIALSINFFDLKPDLPTINNVDFLRNFYRNQIIQHNGGLIEVDIVPLKAYSAVKTIFKIPQEPTGMTYLASLTIPFKTCSYVIKIQAPEIGTTGIRDAVVSNKLLGEGKITIGENGYENWFNDPYNKAVIEGTRMNASENSNYDNEFPDHPLSKARQILDEIEQHIEFKSEIGKLSRFDS